MTRRAVWFRRDLRLNDHTALAKALEHTKGDDQIVLFFHIHPSLNQSFTPRHDYFFQTLKSVVDRADERKAPFHFIYGETEKAFRHLIKDLKVEMVYFNKDEVGFGKDRDESITQYLSERDVEVYAYNDHHLHGADEVKKNDGGFYKVFSPYLKKWKQLQKPAIQKVDFDQLSSSALDEREAFSEGRRAYDDLIKKNTRRL
ncbi:deoxyribodipyrimidine photo-lyase [Halobacillus litoralis]|uniref:deoxyribodipyrimidine photo-lyase n=1 Tax=Halobacillus litoralis TaxID=45668 RepID=UPI00273E5BC7|nr:deoxyribodipyrimidine photo-lyase [Halobacillus litoralis]WLR48854.1 deoxyribodipyrimidine photo-lyase [Halobacillus litoralis]